jgi:hypothetical protein
VKVAGIDTLPNVVLNAPPSSGTQRSGVMIQSDGARWWIVGSANAANGIVTWGVHNKAASFGNNCLSLNNVNQPSPCEFLFAAFMNDSTDTSFGPTPHGGMTITGLFARGAGMTPSEAYTIDVIATVETLLPPPAGTTVLLSCVIDSGASTCDDPTSAPVPGDAYLQVRVTASKTAANAKWRVIFLY